MAKNYIKITKSMKVYNDILFVLRILPRKDQHDKCNLHLLYIDNNKIYATDGYRLHIATLLINIKNGLYEMAKNGNDIYLLYCEDQKTKYPDVKKTIPDKKEGEVIKFNGCQDENYVSKLLGEIYKKGVAINYRFIKDLGKGQAWDIYIYGELQPVLFVSLSCEAILMPFMIERIEIS